MRSRIGTFDADGEAGAPSCAGVESSFVIVPISLPHLPASLPCPPGSGLRREGPVPDLRISAGPRTFRGRVTSKSTSVLTEERMTTSPVPVIFIHGLWIHSDAWQPWVELYRSAGYNAMAPGWPGDSGSVETTRRNAAGVAGKGLDDITSSYLDVIRGLPAKPVVIGHSFGGLIAQKLLSEGVAAAAIAIDPGQIKGVRPLPLAQIRSGLPVLSKPGNRKRAVALTREQFRYSFGNAITERESAELFDKWVIPGPGKPLFEAS